jgi:hypothetical protein
LSPLFWFQHFDVLDVIHLLKATEDLTRSMKLEVVIEFLLGLNQVEDQLNAFYRTKGCDGLRSYSIWRFKVAGVLLSRTVLDEVLTDLVLSFITNGAPSRSYEEDQSIFDFICDVIF